MIKIGYYQKLVVEPLQQSARSLNVRLREIGKQHSSEIYSVETGGNGLFVTACHHANEIYGTYQSVINSLNNGVQMSAVPVVNVSGFEYMHQLIEEDFKKMPDDEKTPFIHFLYESLAGGYKNVGNSPIIYPSWNVYNYGSPNKKPQSSLEIEKIVVNSLVVVDIHNHPSDYYLLIVHETNSEIQLDIEEITKSVIIKKNQLGEIYGGNYAEIRKKIYINKLNRRTLIRFAGEINLANIVLEVPSFTRDNQGRLARMDEGTIIDTNLEILSRLAEYVSKP